MSSSSFYFDTSPTSSRLLRKWFLQASSFSCSRSDEDSKEDNATAAAAASSAAATGSSAHPHVEQKQKKHDEEEQERGKKKEEEEEEKEETINNLPRILLLDGGVGTHLENALREQRRERNRRTMGEHLRENDRIDRDDDDENESSEKVFSHRTLWSSSLLLTRSGQEAVRKCHRDFYVDGGCDIVSTATYQCHYLNCTKKDKEEEQACKQRQGQRKGGEDREEEEEKLTEGVIDDMLRDGVRLAREAAASLASPCAWTRAGGYSNNMPPLSPSSSGDSIQYDDVENVQQVDAERMGASRNLRRERFVAASIGCYGGALADGSEYKGNYGVTQEQLRNFYRRKVRILLSESPDVLAFETIPCLVECAAIIQVLLELRQSSSSPSSTVPPFPPVWISLACRDEFSLNDGACIIDALKTIHSMDPNGELVQGVGINCCSVVHVLTLLMIIAQYMTRTGFKRAIVFYPNSGEEWDAKEEKWVEGTGCMTPEDFANVIESGIIAADTVWNDAVHKGLIDKREEGFRFIVGGCCRTSPETIAAVRRRIDQEFLSKMQS